MTTASVLLTVSTWNCSGEKCDREVIGRAARSVAAVAARELRETPATREQALRLMRDWLRQNKDVANVRQDESFLLRFLRQKKYSIPMAQQTLLKYLNLRKLYPEGFSRLDCEDAHIKDIINNGYIMVSPVRDSMGRRVILYSANRTITAYFSMELFAYLSIFDDAEIDFHSIFIHNTFMEDNVPEKVKRILDEPAFYHLAKEHMHLLYSFGKFNASKFTCWDMCRAHVLVYEACLEEPADQVCGFTHVGDVAGASAAHVTAWNPTDFARLIKWGEQSMPMRHKECHLINLPATVRYVIDFAASRVPPKMAERLKIHANLKSLHKQIDTACLPSSFGGAIQKQDMIQYTRALLSEQRKKLLSLDDMEILSSRGIVTSRSKVAHNADAVEGSFRKLEID